MIAEFIRMNCLGQGRHLDPPRLRQVIHILVYDFTTQHILPVSTLNFRLHTIL
jgi:hypothetical protein